MATELGRTKLQKFLTVLVATTALAVFAPAAMSAKIAVIGGKADDLF
jgi:hypothetical protein